MPAAANLDPLVTRVEEVLIDGAGTARALAAADQFLRATYPGQPGSIRGKDAHQQKSVWVSIDEAELNGGHQEIADRAHYRVAMRVEMSYFIDTELRRSQLRTVVNLAATDMHLVRAALGWPGNLTQTTAGADTGLGGRALTMVGWDKQEPDPENKLLLAIMILEGIVDVTNPV